jgi:hypothetical protein
MTIKIEIREQDALKIADALNHVWREVFDKGREHDALILAARQIAEKAKLNRRY